MLSERKLYGRRTLSDFIGKVRLIDIDADADHHVPDLCLLEAHLGQNPGELTVFALSADHQVIGPFDPGAKAIAIRMRRTDFREQICHGLTRRERHDKRAHGSFVRPQRGPEQNAHVDVAVRHGNPGPPAASLSGCLRGSHRKGPLRGALVGHPQDIVIGGAGLLLKDQRMSRPAGMKKPLNFLRVEQVRLLFVRLPEPVSPVGHGLNGVALFPEPSNRLPDSGAGNAEPAAQLLPGDILCVRLPQRI